MAEPAVERVELDALLIRARDGERAAVEAAFELLWPPTLAYATALERKQGRTGGAEDVAQEALVTLFERLDEYDPARSGLGWALSITYWHSRTAAGRTRRRRENSGDLATERLVGNEPEADQQLAAEEHLTLLRSLTASLTDDERRILGLEEAQLEAPGGGLELIAPATLRKRKQRLIDRLRGAFQELAR
ncbi:MAG TPA: hypothetical protein VLC09_17215 [Polyangiaceae bacterium]|nr:hypothetical protein [Polyangiaceae bacterium]